jgi:hypothetical protein
MAKRSIRAFLRALKEQINAETRKLDEMAAERDRIIMKEQQKVAVQFSKVEALKDVLKTLEPDETPTHLRPQKKKKAPELIVDNAVAEMPKEVNPA